MDRHETETETETDVDTETETETETKKWQVSCVRSARCVHHCPARKESLRYKPYWNSGEAAARLPHCTELLRPDVGYCRNPRFDCCDKAPGSTPQQAGAHHAKHPPHLPLRAARPRVQHRTTQRLRKGLRGTDVGVCM